MNQPTLDTFVCIHHRDVDYLLETVLRSYEANFRPKGRLFMITNDTAYLQRFLDDTDLAQDVTLTADADWLSKKELELPGWYRQQLIKLRSYQFCETANFCNLGADTVPLQPIFYEDLVDENDFPILYYTRHTLPDQHVRYERERIRHIARILQVEPNNALLYTDFINDLFTFNGEMLKSLDAYLKRLYGDEPYVRLLHDLDDRSVNRNKFGEWTLYSVYLLDVLKRQVTMQNTRPDFLYQVHGRLSLYLCNFDTKVVHFVGKNFDVDQIKAQIARRQLQLQP
ncbi:MAG: hypothetical protein H7175_26930 [Burkholderiales bacterium]|nr:hypothetical protein [Anaerolineae bacterium]